MAAPATRKSPVVKSPVAKTAPRSRGAAETAVDKQLASDRIRADTEAFRKAGGRIEKLGNTRVLTRIDPA